MSLVLKLLWASYQRLDAENKDTRTDNLLFLGSPLPILGITFAYLIFVLKLGPSLMKNRKAYDLKYVLMIYNLFQVFANLCLVYMITGLFITYNTLAEWSCLQNDRSNTTFSISLLRLSHFYYFLKVADYMDTIFFVLRKRHSQITFLHVYHHFGMVICTYIVARYVTGGQCIILAYLNTYVHAIMYFYYFISALRPVMKNSLWWKKYITQLQIVQFLLNIVHFSAALLRKDCHQSKILMSYSMLQNLFMAGMFMDFYVKAYLRKPKLKEAL